MRHYLASFIVVVHFSSSSQQINIQYLGNEGVFIRSDSVNILIDALFEENFNIYQMVPDSIQQMIIKGQAPFEKIEYYFISHEHKDHFSARLLNQLLDNHPETKIVSSPQVLNQLDRASIPAHQLVEVLTDINEGFKRVDLGKLDVQAAWVRHPYKKNHTIINLVNLINIKGFKIIHFGDSEVLAENFEILDLAARKIDLALVPIWFLLPEGSEVLDMIGAGKIIGIHSIKDFSSDEKIFREYGEAIWFNGNH